MANVKRTQLKTALQTSRSAFLYVGLFSFLVNILMLTIPIYMLQIFDRVVTSGSTETLAYLTLIALVAILVLALLDIARSRILVKVSTWLDLHLSPKAFSYSADEVLRGGNYATQSLRDINLLRQFLGGSSIFSFFDAPWTPVYLVVLFLFHAALGILATVGAIVLFIFALLNEIFTKDGVARANQIHMHNQMQLDGAMRNAEAIQAMGMLTAVKQRWANQNNEVLTLQADSSDRSALILSTSKFVRMGLQLGILGLGAYYVIQQVITPGTMIAASIITARALAPIEQAISTWKQFIGVRGAYTRLEEYLEQPDPRGERIELPKPTGKLSVEGLSYVPPNQSKPIVHGVQFSLEPGEVLAVIGPSGAGKSTLARLLLGIWQPSAGQARLDGANVFQWDRDDFGTAVGYLPQDVDLFAGTVRENIARLREHEDSDVIQAAQVAGAHELVLQLPQGYETNVEAFSLSGGQRQPCGISTSVFWQSQPGGIG